MGSAHKYAQSHIADADFGVILELLTGPYADVIDQFHHVLDEDHARLDKAEQGLRAADRLYKGMETQTAADFARLDRGQKGEIEVDGESIGFEDVTAGESQLVPPSSEGITIPEVSFGWLLDQACELISLVGGPDLREEVTKYLAGDLDKAAMQANAWDATADCVGAVKANLASGQEVITHSWSGDASRAAG